MLTGNSATENTPTVSTPETDPRIAGISDDCAPSTLVVRLE